MNEKIYTIRCETYENALFFRNIIVLAFGRRWYGFNLFTTNVHGGNSSFILRWDAVTNFDEFIASRLIEDLNLLGIGTIVTLGT